MIAKVQSSLRTAALSAREFADSNALLIQAIVESLTPNDLWPLADRRYCWAEPFTISAKGISSPEASFSEAEKIQWS